MTDPVKVCEAVLGRLKQVPDLDSWPGLLGEPSPMPARCYVVEPDPARAADYTTTPPTWFIRVALFVVSGDQMASLLKMSPLAGTKGPIIKALKDTMCDYDDDLSRMSQTVQPTMLSGLRIVRMNRDRYRRAYIGFSIKAN